MDEKLVDRLCSIIDELPDEGAEIDYKVIPYKLDNRAEFVRDLCAFLNCEESYGKDKYIIFGVDNQKQIIGLLPNNSMQDDDFYQQLAKIIFPKPSIKTGIFKHIINNKKYVFGYILIYGTNMDRVYEICEDRIFSNNKNGYYQDINKKTVYASTSFIRVGSIKQRLTEYQRRKIYENDLKKKTFTASIPLNYFDINSSIINERIIKTVILFGGWDENNKYDTEIISEYIGQPYNDWINILRTLIKGNNGIIEYKNNVWRVADRISKIKSYASNYYSNEINSFMTLVIRILSERNTKFDLLSNQRSMAQFYNKGVCFSKIIRKSVAESLLIVYAYKTNFINCKSDANNLALLVVRNVLNSNNWEVWAGLEDLLPLLAEAAPEEFLNQIDDKLRKNTELIWKLLNEKETDIISHNYSVDFYSSLQLIAWDNRNFMTACMLLLKIAQFDTMAIKQIADIILPWYPQTRASFEDRFILVKNVLKENPKLGWELLMYLMPGAITTASPSYKPSVINKVNDDFVFNDEEYWQQITEYLNLAILNSKINTQKLCDLIDLLDILPKNLFAKIVSKLSNSKVIGLNEKRRYIVWDYLENIIIKNKRHTKSSIPKELIHELEVLSSLLKPTNILVEAKRYFKKNQHLLIGNRKKSEDILLQKQLEFAKKIVSYDFDIVIDFVLSIDDSRHFGAILLQIDRSNLFEEDILACLESTKQKLVEFAKGYVYKKFNQCGYDWVNILKIESWGSRKQLNFLIELPCDQKSFMFVEKVMGNKYLYYWRKVDIRYVEEVEELNYAIDKLSKVNRSEEVIDLVGTKLYRNENLEYNEEIVIKNLHKLVRNQNKLTQLDTYDIKRIIVNLQKRNIPSAELVQLEWEYLILLDGDEGSPVKLAKMMSEDPNLYLNFLTMVYKPHSMSHNPQKVDEKIATNAYRLLFRWNIVPGIIDGKINKQKLNQWYQEMKVICAKEDRLEVGLYNFGCVLFHSPNDQSGFWIDKNVAEILNEDEAVEIRKGFSNEAFNSVGTINYEPTGSSYDKIALAYEEKADITKKEGFFRLAKTLMELSDTFKRSAENIREHYYDDF